MSLALKITADGVSRASFDLDQVGKRAQNMRPPAPAIRKIVFRSAEQRFQRQGPGWPPLAETTKEKKAAAGQDPRVLRVTHALYESLTGGSGAVEEHRRDLLLFGTTVPYARFHDLGTVNMPKRRLAELTPAEHKKITKLLGGWIADGDT